MSRKDEKMADVETTESRKLAVRALRRARKNLRNPDSKLALIMMAYQNAQDAGTAKWALPEA